MLDDNDVFTSEDSERWLDACVVNANMIGLSTLSFFPWWTLQKHAAWLIENSEKIDNALRERELLPYA